MSAQLKPPLEISIPEKLGPLFEPKQFKVMHGGRGGGKSHSVAQVLLIMGMQKKHRVLCIREIQKSLNESSKLVLADYIDRLDLGWFYEVQDKKIIGRNGTKFSFSGLKDHTADSIKSWESATLVWCEEAHTLTERSCNILIPTIVRNDGSEIWFTLNPDQEDDYVYDRFIKNTDADAWVVQINHAENPWFSRAMDVERLKLKAINADLYAHVWEGQCRSAAGLMFKRDWFQFYDTLPDHLNYYIASDYAVTTDGGDFTEHGVFGIADTGNMYVVDWWHGQTDPAQWIDEWLGLVSKYNPLACFEEAGVILRAVTGSIDRRMRETQVFANRVALPSAGSKAERALGFAARASAGAVYLPKGPMGLRILNQLCAFNGEDGRQDDAVDVCSLVGRGIAQMVGGGSPLAESGERKHGRDYGVHDEEDREDDWKVL